MIEKINQVFEEKFGDATLLVKSPGRVNLIGEHTDYNDGFVLPAAVDLGSYFAVALNNENKFRFYSYNLEDYYETSVNAYEKSEKRWANYLLGVIAQFFKAGKTVHGFDCVFGGDLPMGAGMSSSASLETGLAFAIDQMEGYNYSTYDLVKLSQKAEHEYAGVQCGIMDQFAVMHGKANHVIKLDCRSLDYELFPFEMEDQILILVNTGVKHSLAASEYNKRRQECEAGVSLLQKFDREINSLRDVSSDLIRAHKDEFEPVIYRRCAYVVEENLRVERSCKALEQGNFEEFGRFMYASHDGLKNDYEVSCPELDQLVDLAKRVDGVLGARMMGGGFGGCTINLVKKSAVAQFEKTIRENYKTPEGDSPEIIKVTIDDGTRPVLI
ncbi:MAG: galactokinase [Bacteroidales bacterium]|nr:galactokinase [Bacteroidales bacterium]